MNRGVPSPSPDSEQLPPSLGLVSQGRFDRMTPVSPELVQPQGDALGDEQAGGHRMAAWWESGRVMPRQDVLYGLRLLLDCRELLGEVLNSVAEEADLGDGGVEKANFVGVLHLSQVHPEMTFLDHLSGHDFRQSPCAVPATTLAKNYPRAAL